MTQQIVVIDGGLGDEVLELIEDINSASTEAAYDVLGVLDDDRPEVRPVMCANTALTTNISLGRHVHVNPNTSVGHDATLAEHVAPTPSVAVAGLPPRPLGS